MRRLFLVLAFGVALPIAAQTKTDTTATEKKSSTAKKSSTEKKSSVLSPQSSEKAEETKSPRTEDRGPRTKKTAEDTKSTKKDKTDEKDKTPPSDVFPDIQHERVDYWVAAFSKMHDYHKKIAGGFERKAKYQDMLERKLRKQGMPQNL
ncbi:MAG TPA: hypothetical protein VGR95_20120, partial [Thermoanaerobaculia bacterium]|nr:hypothetical protein [Thermoanaerobaculia bacterium]